MKENDEKLLNENDGDDPAVELTDADIEPDFSPHRQIVSHALKGEPAQMGPIVNDIVRSKISDHMDARRAEIGNNVFTTSDEE